MHCNIKEEASLCDSEYSEVKRVQSGKAARELRILMATAWLDMERSGASDGYLYQWQNEMFYIEHGGVPVALITSQCTEWKSEVFIHAGYVLPEHRRKGLYRRLYQACRDWAISVGVVKIGGGVSGDNEDMIAVCERFGRKASVITFVEDLPVKDGS